MAWIIAIGILIFLGLKFPAFGKFAIGIGILIILAIAYFIFSSQHEQEVRKTLINKDQIELTGLTLRTGSISNYYYLSAPAIKNNSSHELTGMTMVVKAYDCPGSSITPECSVIGEDNNVDIYVDVPAGQTRAINNDGGYVTNGGSVSLNNMPRVNGQFLWSYDISEITAR